MADVKQSLADKRKIHSIAFAQAWFKGFCNRKWSPVAHRQIALIPKTLVSRDGNLLLLRLYPRLELAFEIALPNDALRDVLLGGGAIRLVLRHTDRGRVPKDWSLLI